MVWFLEHCPNLEIEGPWKNDIGTTLWFDFSSLCFAHRISEMFSNSCRCFQSDPEASENGKLKTLEEK
uniref:Uncharacterized protein n=1 Tax=Salix viminalis TaxID=40686 RepID=A0A6N2KKK2_SALVM